MVDAGSLLKAVHALAGLWFLVGLGGRWIALGQAARASEVGALRGMLAVSARFERIVISGGGVVLLLGVATAVAQGRPFLGPLQGAGFDWLFVALLVYLSPLPLVPLVFLPRGRLFAEALAEAISLDTITPRLKAAWRDPVVRAGHVYELTAMLFVFVLMVSKPF